MQASTIHRRAEPGSACDEGRPLRVLLISPKGPLYRHRSGIFRKSLRYMPLTLPTLASLIPDDVPAEVTCVDEGIDAVDFDTPADVVGMTVITGTAPRAYELAHAFRERGATIVLGGPHVTLIPEDAQPHADSIVVGYAEQSWPQLLRDVRNGCLQPRYDQAADLDLADMPLPDRSVLPRRRYLTANVFEATRGCIHNCDFCVVPSAWGRKPLQKPVADVVADLRAQQARRAIFVDLNIIADKAYARQLFEALTPLKIQWYGLATTLLCDDLPLLDLAARSGCRGLLMGLESIDTANLRRSRKGFNDPDAYGKVVQRLHERGIALQGCFVFGLDHDRPDVFEKTARFAVETAIDLPRFAIVTPFPGTGLYQRLEREGRILTRNWELYDGQHVVFQPKHLEVDELQAGTERAWQIAYGWRNIARRLRHTAAPWTVALTTNLGYRYYAHNLHRFYTCDWMLAGRDAKPTAAVVGAPVPLTMSGERANG
ncbi:MAG: radical SAM protein [Phycisphaeraceae bacterium]